MTLSEASEALGINRTNAATSNPEMGTDSIGGTSGLGEIGGLSYYNIMQRVRVDTQPFEPPKPITNPSLVGQLDHYYDATLSSGTSLSYHTHTPSYQVSDTGHKPVHTVSPSPQPQYYDTTISEPSQSSQSSGQSSKSEETTDGTVRTWLQLIKLGEYWPHFERLGVDDMAFLQNYVGSSQSELEDEFELSTFMTKPAHRKMFCKRLNEMKKM